MYSDYSEGTSRQASRGPTNEIIILQPSKPKCEDTSDIRPTLVKRTRKAINCEPCRHSKLKCDRNRPCSSCVLRGTTAMCYQGSGGSIPPEPKRIDVIKEFSRIRQSVSMLETHFLTGSRRSNDKLLLANGQDQSPAAVKLSATSNDPAPGMLGMQGHGGTYSGATSAASHLVTDDISPPPSDERRSSFASQEYDHDLIELLPHMDIIDNLIDYYFEYCNWVYRTVNRATFLPAWQNYKGGRAPDRLILATACILMSYALRYLPKGHDLLVGLSTQSNQEPSVHYYTVMRKALTRYKEETKGYTLELVELLLATAFYLTHSKTDIEEIWSVKGELMTIGTAMGLHRDPGHGRFSAEVAERRRWAWWNIYLLESWQAFTFGRPMSLASHHFNAHLPTYCDPQLDPTGRLFLPNIALFKLAFILGEILDDAVSLRSVPYESTLTKDKMLVDWIASLPADIGVDEYQIVRNLSSSDIAVRRLGVQSIVLLSSYYHMRFTLHRPHASPTKESTKKSQSLEIAVTSAEKLISLAAQTSPEFMALESGTQPPKSPPHVHGHMNWRPFHVFSAAMFFTFQLIRNPDQPGSNLFRSYIRKALRILNSERTHNTPVAGKSLNVLLALAPLYSEEYLALDEEGRGKEKATVLMTVKTLDFPYQDPPVRASTAGYIGTSPVNESNSDSSYRRSSICSVRSESQVELDGIYASSSSSMPVSNMRSYPGPILSDYVGQPMPPYCNESGTNFSNERGGYVYASEDWGGAMGFVPSEWIGFMDGLHQTSGGG